MQHVVVPVIPEADTIEADGSTYPARINRAGAFLDHLVGRKDRLNSLQRDRHLGDSAGHAREILNRLEELLQIGEVDGQRAGGHRSGNDQ